MYENHPDFSAFPTYPIVLNFSTDQDVVSFPSEAMTEGGTLPASPRRPRWPRRRKITWRIRPLDTDGEEPTLRSRVIGVHKRSSGASAGDGRRLLSTAKGETICRLSAVHLWWAPTGLKIRASPTLRRSRSHRGHPMPL